MVFSQLFKRKPKQEEVARLQSSVRQGTNLRLLREVEGWEDLESVKEYFQDNAGKVSVNPLSDDKARLIAAVEYTTLHNFFLELSRRIKVGEDAQNELNKLVKK